jgi:hypothetical protein
VAATRRLKLLGTGPLVASHRHSNFHEAHVLARSGHRKAQLLTQSGHFLHRDQAAIPIVNPSVVETKSGMEMSKGCGGSIVSSLSWGEV